MCNIPGDQNVDPKTGERIVTPIPDSDKNRIYSPVPAHLLQDLDLKEAPKAAVKGRLSG